MKKAAVVLTTYTSENLDALRKTGWMIEHISSPIWQKIEQRIALLVRRQLVIFDTPGCLRHLACIEHGWDLVEDILAKNWLGFRPAVSYLETPLKDNLGENTAVVVLWPAQTYPFHSHLQHAAVAWRRQHEETP